MEINFTLLSLLPIAVIFICPWSILLFWKEEYFSSFPLRNHPPPLSGQILVQLTPHPAGPMTHILRLNVLHPSDQCVWGVFSLGIFVIMGTGRILPRACQWMCPGLGGGHLIALLARPVWNEDNARTRREEKWKVTQIPEGLIYVPDPMETTNLTFQLCRPFIKCF